MEHTLEIIKNQLRSPVYLTAGDNYLGLKREQWPKIGPDLFPLTQDYFHDLNPFFGFNVVNFDFFKSFPIVTLRDGALTAGIFLVQNFHKIQKSNQLILIHEDFKHFAPEQNQSNYLSYKMVQPQRINIQDASQIIVVGILSDQMLQDETNLWKKIKILKKASPTAKIKFYIQTRKNPYDFQYAESHKTHPFLFKLYQELNIRPEFLTTEQLFNIGMLKSSYVINLQTDRYIIADSFTDYLLASKGATIHEWESPSPKTPFLSIPVSLYHQMEVNPIQYKSIFNELVFLRKRSTLSEPAFDGYVYAKYRELFLKK